ncbi:hypothetical protein TNCV_467561 [Trichonephila clavipes]|nr:hypothetical protein TNCV_467561 [Trichonephila clavipes]
MCLNGWSFPSESWGRIELRSELYFNFTRIPDVSVIGKVSPIMHRKRFHALRCREKREDRKRGRGTVIIPILKKESEKNYWENRERHLAIENDGEDRSSDKRKVGVESTREHVF